MSLSPPSGTELKEFRRQTGLSQAGLAAELGASTRAVEEWEAGRRPAPPMLRLALTAVLEQRPGWSYEAPWIGEAADKMIRDSDG